MDPVTGMLIGGLGSSLIGGLFGSSGASKQAKAELQAARENRDFLSGQFGRSQAQAAFGILGGPQGEAWLRASLGPQGFDQLFGRAATNPNFNPDQQRSLDEINRQLALPVAVASTNPIFRSINRGATITPEQKQALMAQRDALTTAAGGSPGITGQLDLNAFRGMGPSVIDQMKNLGASYDSATGGLMDYARSIEQQAQGFGQQERERINRDSADALTSANRNAQSTLIGRGLGASTVLSGVMGQNARNIGAAREDALGSLGDRQINLLTGIRGNAMSMLAGRSAGSTQLAQAPINTRLQFLTGGIANPWQQRDTSQFFPGVSPGGAAASTFGNLLAGAGGQFGNLGMMALLNGGGGGGGLSGDTIARAMANNPNSMYQWNGMGTRIA